MRPAKQRGPSRRAIITLALLVLISLTQCRRSESDDPAGGGRVPPADRDNAAAAESGAMELTEAGRERAEQERAPGDPIEAPPLQIDARDSAFAARRLETAPLYPVDYYLGSLRPSGLSAAEQAARLAAGVFLDEFVAGRAVPPGSLLDQSPGAIAELEELIVDLEERTGFRLGRPVVLPAGDVSVPFRLTSDSAGWTGELVLERADGEWYTSDVQVNRLREGDAGPYAPDR